MGIAVPSQLRKASHQLNMALIGYYGLGLGGYGWAGLGGLVAPLAIHRDGPFLCGNGEHLINGLCKKKRSAEAEPEAYYGAIGYGYGAAVPSTGLPVQPLVPAGPWGALVPARPQLLRLLRLTTLLPLASVRLTLMPTTVMAAMVGMEPTPLDTGLATAMAVTARDPLTLRLMPTMAMEAMVDMVLATPLATVLATAMGAMAKGLLILRPMPSTAMEA